MKRPIRWLCPHCGYWYDSEVEECVEEATVGQVFGGCAHITCPGCGRCMGCECCKGVGV